MAIRSDRPNPGQNLYVPTSSLLSVFAPSYPTPRAHSLLVWSDDPHIHLLTLRARSRMDPDGVYRTEFVLLDDEVLELQAKGVSLFLVR